MMALDKRYGGKISVAAAELQSGNGAVLHSLFGNDGPPPGFTSGGGNGGSDPFHEACSLVSVNLAAYQDGELDQDTYEAVDTHIAHCNRCSAMLFSLQETDILIEREWREYPPLPSPSEVKQSIDNIMSNLPVAAEAPQEFSPKRIHAKVRWMRFSTGFMEFLVALFSLLWTSYKLGFTQGMQLSNYKPLQPTPQTGASPISYRSMHSPSELSTAILSASKIPRTSSYTSSAVISRMHL